MSSVPVPLEIILVNSNTGVYTLSTQHLPHATEEFPYALDYSRAEG